MLVEIRSADVAGIPALPISFADAAPLLKALNGHGVKIESWKGGLGAHGVEYWTGNDSSPQVKLFNDVKEGAPSSVLVRCSRYQASNRSGIPWL